MDMWELPRMNGQRIAINPKLVSLVQQDDMGSPHTILEMASGWRVLVTESFDAVLERLRWPSGRPQVETLHGTF